MRLQLVTIVIALSTSSLFADETLYLREVKPLLAARCASCHGALAQKANLRLDTAAFILKGGRNGPAVVAGKGEMSLLVDAVLGKDHVRMPPESEGTPLSAEEVAVLRKWIDAGAKGPANEPIPEDPREHWAFRKPVRPTLPDMTDSGTAANPIDRLLAVEHAKHNLHPRPPVDRATLLRRVSLDLIGLPPTREQLHAFLADPSEIAYEKVVDRLLASPQYGERWARHWMDVWRYSDWYGRRHVPDVWNSAPQIWRWRDWIVNSLNRDHGYDRMVREMLAADEIAPEDYEAGHATGYLIRNWYALNPNDWMRNTVEHTGKAFLGLTFNCAHCHDHKYDPIAQVDYFRLRAFFEPIYVRQDRVPGEADPGPFQDYNYSTLRKIQRLGAVRIFDKTPDAPTWFYTGGDERNRLTERGSISPGLPSFLADSLPKIEKVELPPRAWYPGLRPDILETILADAHRAVEQAETELAAARKTKSGMQLAEANQAAARAELASINARIAADRARHGETPGADTNALIREASRLERQANLRGAEANLLAQEHALGEAEMGKDAKKIEAAKKALTPARAALDKAKAALADDTLAETYTPFSPTYPRASTGRRKALAEWVTSRDNPLAARVAVNHIWMRHFHAPLVASVYDFGRNGSRPTHPQLLDWLAVELMESGWSMKHLHRLIVTSDAYRRASSVGDALANVEVDPENKLLWRMNAGRMEAEVVRDSLLFCAGRLDPKMGGQELENGDSLTSHRRSLYYSVFPELGGKSPLGKLFDGPDALECYRRSRSVVPQQALALTNSELVHQMSAALAAALWNEVQGELKSDTRNGKFIIIAFERILSRTPTSKEVELCSSFLAERASDGEVRARESLVRALFNHNDFITIR